MHTLSTIRKIGILKASALGDFIVTVPALEAIRARWPAAAIVLLGRAWHEAWLQKGRTPVDRVIALPAVPGVTIDVAHEVDKAMLTSLYETLQAEQFDLFFNFQGNGEHTNAFARAIRPRLLAGPAFPDDHLPDYSMPYYHYQHEVVRYIEMASVTGTEKKIVEPAIRVLPDDLMEARVPLLTVNNKRYVVFHPFSRDIRRMWPLENYVALGRRLKEQYEVEIIITGTEEERGAVEAIEAHMQYPVINACGTLSLGGLTALLAGASLVVACDTGPLHLARAVQTPTVGIYWAPNYIKWGPLTRAIHRPVISWEMQCPLCGIVPNNPWPFEPRKGCDHPVSFVRDISVEEVWRQAEELLSGVHVRGMERKETYEMEEGMRKE